MNPTTQQIISFAQSLSEVPDAVSRIPAHDQHARTGLVAFYHWSQEHPEKAMYFANALAPERDPHCGGLVSTIISLALMGAFKGLKLPPLFFTACAYSEQEDEDFRKTIDEDEDYTTKTIDAYVELQPHHIVYPQNGFSPFHQNVMEHLVDFTDRLGEILRHDTEDIRDIRVCRAFIQEHFKYHDLALKVIQNPAYFPCFFEKQSAVAIKAQVEHFTTQETLEQCTPTPTSSQSAPRL